MSNSLYTHALLTHSKQVPRYTSYPTAPCFSVLDSSIYAPWLSAVIPNTPVSLYLHVPYCKKLCWFCGCHTRITERYEPVSSYIKLLMREIELVHEAIGRIQPVNHIHWGGGSPTMLSAEDFSSCMKHLQSHFNIMHDAEIAIEIDPRNVSEARMAAYAKWGVNRVSLGVQDFDAQVQAAINRIQPYHVVYQVVQLARQYGITAINLDLIYGLPKQTTTSLLKTIELVLTLNPSRISLFGYAHVPWKKKNIRLIEDADLPDEAMRIELFDAASSLLTSAGFVAIGIDHFARPDDPMAIAHSNHTLHRNFQGYTTDACPTLIGLGASSIGSFEQGYVQNYASVEAYERAISNHLLPVNKGIILTADDKVRRAIIESLMCYLKADIASISHSSNLPDNHFDAILNGLSSLAHDGLITVQNRVICINPHVPQAARIASAAFDAYFVPTGRKHSQVA